MGAVLCREVQAEAAPAATMAVLRCGHVPYCLVAMAMAMAMAILPHHTLLDHDDVPPPPPPLNCM